MHAAGVLNKQSHLQLIPSKPGVPTAASCQTWRHQRQQSKSKTELIKYAISSAAHRLSHPGDQRKCTKRARCATAGRQTPFGRSPGRRLRPLRFRLRQSGGNNHHRKNGAGPIALRGSNTPHVRFGSGADIARLFTNVRFPPESGQKADVSGCPLCAKSGHSHRSKKARYSRAVRQKEARHAVTARSTPVHYSG